MKAKSAPRGPGRRTASTADNTDTRHQLLVAARAEFARHGFRGTTIRRVADRAAVTPAMVHYHFGDKHGLYRAVLDETIGPLLQNLEQLAARGGSGSLHDALFSYMHQLGHTPELPALLLRDVLAADGVMRDTFIRDFAARGAGAMRSILERDFAHGRLREDLDPRLALLSLMSMAAFPFIARPVAEKVLGLVYDDAMIRQLAEHTALLFYAGASREVHRS